MLAKQHVADAIDKKTKRRNEHWLSTEQVQGFQSVKDWINGLPEPKSDKTLRAYLWSMQGYTDYIRQTPDELIESRNKELGSPDTITKTTAERNLERFYSAYPRKTSALAIMKAVMSFYKSRRMPLLGVRTPNQDALAVRQKDRLPTDQEIAKMCDLADIKDKLIVMFGAQTGMRVSSLGALQYRHLKADFEKGTIPCRVIIPLYEREFERFGYMAFVCEDTVKTLRDYLESRKVKGETITDESWIFPRHEGSSKSLGSPGIWKMVRQLAMKVGIVPDEAKGVTEFRFHCFRKRAQTVLEGSGTPLNWVDMMLAHQPRGSQGKAYVRPSEDELRKEYLKALANLGDRSP